MGFVGCFRGAAPLRTECRRTARSWYEEMPLSVALSKSAGGEGRTRSPISLTDKQTLKSLSVAGIDWVRRVAVRVEGSRFFRVAGGDRVETDCRDRAAV